MESRRIACGPSWSGSNGWKRKKRRSRPNIRDVYAEAKSAGFDVKILRQIVRLRKMEQSDRQEQEELLDLYKRALDL